MSLVGSSVSSGLRVVTQSRSMECPSLTCMDGSPLARLGLGTWNSAPGEVYAAVRHAISSGYRHIDCAAVYGNEIEVGDALRDAMKAGEVRREELWVTSKLWNDMHEPDMVPVGLEQTLRDLKLDVLDLYLVHWPVPMRPKSAVTATSGRWYTLEDVPLETTWLAMLAQRERGLIRYAGVSNYSLPKVQAMAEIEAPTMNQVELHPHLQQTALLDGCARLSVAVTAYSPLGSPGTAEMFKRDDGVTLLENDEIRRIAEIHQVTPAQVLLAWALARGTLAIPKSTKSHRIDENLAALSVTLTQQDMDDIAKLEHHHRYLDGSLWCTKSSPHTLASLWDESPPSEV